MSGGPLVLRHLIHQGGPWFLDYGEGNPPIVLKLADGVWYRDGSRTLVSRTVLRALRDQGVTHVTLDIPGRSYVCQPAFSIRELLGCSPPPHRGRA